MENTTALPSAVMPKAVAATPAVAKKKEHLLVELVNGMTLAITMVSALSLWYTFLAFGLPSV